jgi:DNA polymerase
MKAEKGKTHLTLDFETRGTVDLIKAGAWRYAEDQNTDVICLAVKTNDEKPRVWAPDWVGESIDSVAIEGQDQIDFLMIESFSLKEVIDSADIIEAHNMGFERAMWFHHMHKKYGFDDLPLGKCRCSAAKAAMHAIPRSLDTAVKALGLPISKDMEGRKLMMKMCKPRNLLKAELVNLVPDYLGEAVEIKELKTAAKIAKAQNFKGSVLVPDVEGNPESVKSEVFLKWHEEPEQIIRLIEYCVQDVETEFHLSQALEDLPSKEQEIWEHDQVINERGMAVDEKAVRAIIKLLEEAQEKLLEEFARVVKDSIRYDSRLIDVYGKLTSPKQSVLLKEWINGYIRPPYIENVRKATIESLLERDTLPAHVRKVLEIRQSLSKSSTAKFETLRTKLCKDGRIRDCFMYHGSRTGRFAGRGFQPQNLPRAGYKEADDLLKIFLNSVFRPVSMSEAEFISGDSIFKMASKLIRPMVFAPEGKDLICADYSSVEARGLAWLAGDEKKLQAFREDRPIYEMAAADIYGKEVSDISSEERQTGKMLELACGYGGGYMAVLAMCRGYGLKELFVHGRNVIVPEEKDGAGKQAFEQAVGPLVAAWREKNSKIKRFWYWLEKSAFEAVSAPGVQSIISVGRSLIENEYFAGAQQAITFQVKPDRFLTIKLPSGRNLYYYDPHFRMLKTSWGELKKTLCYWGVSSQKEKVVEGKPMWGCLSTYGGKLAENITQAVCRDLLVEGMLNVEKHGYPVVLHAHDEAVSEITPGDIMLPHFCRLLSRLPDWAGEFPLKAEGWQGKRYRK